MRIFLFSLALSAFSLSNAQDDAPSTDARLELISTAEEAAADIAYGEENDLITLTSLETPQNDHDDIPFQALRTFVDVFDNIKKHYVREVSNEQLVSYAIYGMLSRLDPHSLYLNENEYHDFEHQSDGDYAGIGIVIDVKDGMIEVVAAVKDSPAAEAGIISGDVITAIDGQSVFELGLQKAMRLLEGGVGTQVTLELLRGEQSVSLHLTRRLIHTNSIASQWLEKGMLYLNISQFQEDTATSIQTALDARSAEQAINALLIDLRDNPGGDLFSAVDSANLFLEQGTILTVRDRNDREQQHYSAETGDALVGKPILVLINRGTASSAEILAAALQENHRAVVVGESSYGKGTVQTLFPLYHGGAIKLTTGRYVTPAGKQLQDRGITPDVTLKPLQSIEDDASEQDSILYQAHNLLKALLINTAH